MKERKWLIPFVIAMGCLPWLILFGIVFLGLMVAACGFGGGPVRGDKIALIHVSGVITGGSGGGGFFEGTSAGAENIIEALERARKDKSVKAVVVRIDSPGGSPAGSQEVYNEILRVRKEGKVVVASMADVAASGGYYIAAACDKIYANGSTLTGSIGVIMETTDMSQLYKKIGLDVNVIKTGKFKDMGSGARKMTPEERQIVAAMLDDTFRQFISAVSQGRKMPESEVRKLADGRVFTGRQAKKLGLVDSIGGLLDAEKWAASEVGIKGELKIIEHEKSFLKNLMGSTETRSKVDEALLRRLLDRAPAIPR